MTREEALAELGTRWRLRAALYVEHAARRATLDGATMGTTPAELRAAAHALVDRMLDRLEGRVTAEPAP